MWLFMFLQSLCKCFSIKKSKAGNSLIAINPLISDQNKKWTIKISKLAVFYVNLDHKTKTCLSRWAIFVANNQRLHYNHFVPKIIMIMIQ